MTAKVANIQKAREKKGQRSAPAAHHDGFQPCSPDMTICGDCESNRAKKACPRLKEWQANKRS